MSDESLPEVSLDQMEWCEIREPGCYLHIASGLVARVYAEDVAGAKADRQGHGGGRVVRLLPNPGAPLAMLREIAEHHGFRMNS